MSLAQFPAELYSAIINHIPPEDVQCTVLSLTRLFPTSVPLYHLFEKIHIRRPEQVPSLYRRLRRKSAPVNENGDDASNPVVSWVRELSFEDWSVDADVVLNTVKLLPNLKSLNLWIGPKNFAPEHLEELFEKPLPTLRYLGLRFRPYVQKATYYQFLKGAYFDSALLALSRWPPSQLPVLSIVQDPIDSNIVFAPRQAFAQPLVFFKLDPYISVLLQSNALSECLKSFRLRVPSRPVVRSLCYSSPMLLNSDGEPVQIPKLEILDLSTSGVLEGEVDMILVHFRTLKHLLLDDCAVLRGELREGEWNAMGKRCALIGVRRAKECEKVFKAWLESRTIVQPLGADGAPAQAQQAMTRRPRRGRRGLATATISIRSHSPPRRPQFPASPNHIRGAVPKIRILPPLPSLLTLCTTTSPVIKPESYGGIRAEFEAGWAEGIAQLAVTRGRLRDSAKLGAIIMRFVDDPLPNDDEISEQAALHGLEVVDKSNLEAFDMTENGSEGLLAIKTPVLCFAGTKNTGSHVEGCGHSIASAIWKD